MGLKKSLTSLLLAAPLALAHSAKDIPLGPIERRDLNHCTRDFHEEAFMKRTVEIHGKEFARLRRNLGLDPEDMDTYGSLSSNGNIVLTRGKQSRNPQAELHQCLQG